MKLRTVILICISFGLGVFISLLYIKFSKEIKNFPPPDVSLYDKLRDLDLVSSEVIAGFKKSAENQASIGPFYTQYSNDMNSYSIMLRSNKKIFVSEIEGENRQEEKTIVRSYFLDDEANHISIHFERDRQSKKLLPCLLQINNIRYLDRDGDGRWDSITDVDSGCPLDDLPPQNTEPNTQTDEN